MRCVPDVGLCLNLFTAANYPANTWPPSRSSRYPLWDVMWMLHRHPTWLWITSLGKKIHVRLLYHSLTWKFCNLLSSISRKKNIPILHCWYHSCLIILSRKKRWHHRADSRFVPSQEMALFCNDAYHWLGASLESALQQSWHWLISLVGMIQTPNGTNLQKRCRRHDFSKRLLNRTLMLMWHRCDILLGCLHDVRRTSMYLTIKCFVLLWLLSNYCMLRVKLWYLQYTDWRYDSFMPSPCYAVYEVPDIGRPMHRLVMLWVGNRLLN